MCDEAMPEWARWQILQFSIVASGKVLARVSAKHWRQLYQLRVVLEGSSSELDVASAATPLRSQPGACQEAAIAPPTHAPERLRSQR